VIILNGVGSGDLINARSVPIFLKDTFLSVVGVTYRPAIDADETDFEEYLRRS
jgi:hypothetical protein